MKKSGAHLCLLTLECDQWNMACKCVCVLACVCSYICALVCVWMGVFVRVNKSPAGDRRERDRER